MIPFHISTNPLNQVIFVGPNLVFPEALEDILSLLTRRLKVPTGAQGLVLRGKRPRCDLLQSDVFQKFKSRQEEGGWVDPLLAHRLTGNRED